METTRYLTILSHQLCFKQELVLEYKTRNTERLEQNRAVAHPAQDKNDFFCLCISKTYPSNSPFDPPSMYGPAQLFSSISATG
jgi:hypothetical protein